MRRAPSNKYSTNLQYAHSAPSGAEGQEIARRTQVCPARPSDSSKTAAGTMRGPLQAGRRPYPTRRRHGRGTLIRFAPRNAARS